MSVKWRFSAALILCLATVTFGDERQSSAPSRETSTNAKQSHTSSTLELVRQAAEHLEAAGNIEEDSTANGRSEQVNLRTVDEAKELSRQIAAVQQKLNRLRQMTGRPDQITFQFRVLEIPAKAAAELPSLGAQRLANPGFPRSIYKSTPELNKRLQELDGVKTVCDTQIVATPGRPANFMSGGEFPIMVPGKGGTTTVEWREFGVRCELVPVILDAGRLRVELNAEVSHRDMENAVEINGTRVPGLTTRRVNTQAEMNFGETLVVALPTMTIGKPKAESPAAPENQLVTLFMLTPTAVEDSSKK